METLTLGMQNLRIAEFLSEKRSPSDGDVSRLERGKQFIHRILAAFSFFVDGQTDGLEENSFSQARYVCATVKELREATTAPAAREYLSTLSEQLSRLIDGEEIPQGVRQNLLEFFAATGEAMISEVMDPVSPDWGTSGDEAPDRLSATSAI